MSPSYVAAQFIERRRLYQGRTDECSEFLRDLHHLIDAFPGVQRESDLGEFRAEYLLEDPRSDEFRQPVEEVELKRLPFPETELPKNISAFPACPDELPDAFSILGKGVVIAIVFVEDI